MSLLGMGSAWWSLTGLVIDIAGFAVLTWDLLPEYKLNKAWQYLRSSQREADQLESGEFASDDMADAADALGHANLRTIYQTREKIQRSLITSDLWLAADTAGRAEFVPAIEALRDRPSFDRQKFDELHASLERSLEVKETSLHRRKRPPLRFGIGLVIIGFVLQAWGTIPLT